MQVVGFDMVDDESKPERRPTKHMPTPSQWTNDFNPAFSYYAYYCYANLFTLNKVRLILLLSLLCQIIAEKTSYQSLQSAALTFVHPLYLYVFVVLVVLEHKELRNTTCH